MTPIEDEVGLPGEPAAGEGLDEQALEGELRKLLDESGPAAGGESAKTLRCLPPPAYGIITWCACLASQHQAEQDAGSGRWRHSDAGGNDD